MLTGYSLFQLWLEFSSQLILLFIQLPHNNGPKVLKALQILEQLQNNIKDTQDSFITTKIKQAYHTNLYHTVEKPYQERDMIIFSIRNYQSLYKSKRDEYPAKFIPKYDKL